MAHAHPILIYHLCILFRAISVHSFVPNDFGIGLIVPLVKDKTGDINSVDNYRGITLTPVVAKVFECVLLSKCEEFLVTDNLQFGFKRHVGCPQAVFTLRSVIDYFISRGSGVYAAALDISKAFDNVCHAKLFQCLVDTGVPGWIVMVLENWYSKLCVAVRWIDAISGFFNVMSGVRQGSILSPRLFTVLINIVIVKLKDSGVGCSINNIFIGCILYADDIIVLSATVSGLQEMLNICNKTIMDMDLSFNCKKSVCIRFGPVCKYTITDMYIGSSTITWCNSIRYLGVNIESGSCFKVDTDIVRRKFFASCNAILSNSVHQSELLRLNLMECYSLPILQYCVAAIKFTDTQLKALNACWNMAFRKIFGFHRWESVKTFICGLGRLDFKHIYALRCFKFWKSVCISSNVVLRTVFSCFANSQDFNQLCCSYGVSVMGMNFSELTSAVYEHFRTSIM